MYWASSLVANAVTARLVSPRAVRRIERRVRRRTRDVSACDVVWADELVRSRLISPYQAQALLRYPALTNDGEPAGVRGVFDWPIQLGPYLVLDRVGRSDLGETYRCRAASGGETWAVKRLLARWSEFEDLADRLAEVIEAWNALADVRVATMKRLTLADRRVGLATRWLRGTNLADLLRAGRRLSPAVGVSVVRELVAVLATADGHALAHGDLRPSNIFVDGRGQVVLTDCGLRCAIPGAVPVIARRLPPERYDYVAPEVAAGELPPDAASDIYSLGCVFYHLVTGRPPFLDGDVGRKLAAHRDGQIVHPRSLGIELTAEARLLLDATLQSDRARRARSYNDLLSRMPPQTGRSAQRVRSELRRGRWAEPSSEPHRVASEGVRNRWARWLVAAAATAASIAGLVQGSGRLMPLLSLRVPTKSASPVPTKYSTGRPAGRAPDDRAVTTLWNATEDLRAAYRAAAPHDTITLQSPGPFLLDAIDVSKPITLRGADDVRPLFVGGPGAALRVVASGVRLENVHFLRVSDVLRGQERHDSRAMVEVLGDQIAIHRCSFDDTGTDESPSIAVEWRPVEADPGQPAQLAVAATLFRRVGAAVSIAGNFGAQITLEDCMHLGPGPLVDSISPHGRPFQTIDISLSNVSVLGSSALAHRFPHPLDDALALNVTARQCLIVPRDREQPLLAVRYAAQPGILMPKVSWSGADTVCPSDATLLAVDRGPGAAPWRASDVSAWHAYWGTHATGVVGVRMGFASSADSRDLPRVTGSEHAKIGVDKTKLCAPTNVTLEQLPLLLERLRSP